MNEQIDTMVSLKVNKRKHNELSFTTKLQILKEVNKGEKSKSQIAALFGIPRSTLSTIIKNKDTLDEVSSKGFELGDRKRFRRAKYVELEDSLHKWLLSKREADIPLSGPLIIKKANELARETGIDGFKCSSGWLWRFQKRFGITAATLSGENSSMSEKETQEWIDDFHGTLLKYIFTSKNKHSDYKKKILTAEPDDSVTNTEDSVELQSENQIVNIPENESVKVKQEMPSKESMKSALEVLEQYISCTSVSQQFQDAFNIISKELQNNFNYI